MADTNIELVQEPSLPVASAKGISSGHRYGKYLPARLTDNYLEALTDEDILSGRDSIALADARVNDLLSKVDSGETQAIWRKLKEAYHELKRAQILGDVNAARAAMVDIENMIEKGSTEYQSWKEVFDLIELRRKLAESEQRRVIGLKQVFTAEQGMKLVRFLITIIKKHVKDEAVLQDISEEISTRLAATMNPKNVY